MMRSSTRFVKYGPESPVVTLKDRDVITFVLKAQTDSEKH